MTGKGAAKYYRYASQVCIAGVDHRYVDRYVLQVCVTGRHCWYASHVWLAGVNYGCELKVCVMGMYYRYVRQVCVTGMYGR